MDVQHILKDILKNMYQKVKTSNQWDRFGQQELRIISFDILAQSTPLAEVLSCDCKHVRTKRIIWTLGECGVGKTTTVQRCALDWAEGKGYNNIGLLFPLTYWELTVLKKKLSFIELLQAFYPELQLLSAANLKRKNVWFVLDGMDGLDVHFSLESPVVKDVLAVSTVGTLIANLINGNLLPNAHIWITSRIAACTIIPHSFILKQTEVKGLDNEQKEQLFRTIIDNDDLVYKAINHMKISVSLSAFCEIPLICTVAATVLKEHVKQSDRFEINPLNLTQIYTRLIKAVNSSTIARLKHIALYFGKKFNFFSAQFLSDFGMNVEEVVAIAREWPLLLRAVTGLSEATVFCFGHSSMQAFLAASANLDKILSQSTDLSSCCRNLVDIAVLRDMGAWDDFILFLFGLLKEQNLLPLTDPLFTHTKNTILGNIFSHVGKRLYNCLREYDSQALLPESSLFWKNGISPLPNFSLLHWSVMAQTSRLVEGTQIQFSIKASKSCDQTLARSFTDILKSSEAVLRLSNLTDLCCPALVAAMTYKESYLRVLDLGYNSITDAGVKNLVEGMTDKKCCLKVLRLQCCELTSRACAYLATALSRRLKGLDISSNNIGDEGLRLLAEGLASPECLLEELRLSQCCIEAQGCRHLALALEKNPEHLKVLDLSVNIIRDKGAGEIFEKFNISKLRTLDIYHCGLTSLSCVGIGKALKYESSTLVEMNLSHNQLGDAGLTILSEGMHAWCSLQKLNVSRCGITSGSCPYFAKVLSSVSQLYSDGTIKTDWQAVELIELNLSLNSLGDQGADHISSGLECNPYSHLKTLNLSQCGLTHKCCIELSKALASEKSVVSELDLSDNNIGDQGLKRLCVGLRSPQSTVQTLLLQSCGLSRKCVQFLVSALKCNPYYLKELHLLGNNLDESDISPLVELRRKHPYILEIIDFTAPSTLKLRSDRL